MSDNPEIGFAEEAQEEALLSRVESYEPRSSSSKQHAHSSVEEQNGGSGETSPLLSASDGARRRYNYQRAGDSYQRAVNEPWTGAHRAGNLPWYKTPSVFWLLPAFFPFCIAFGGLMVPRTYLVLDLICNDYLSDKAAKDPNFHFLPVVFGEADNPQCRDPEVQKRVAWFNAGMDLITGICSAIVTPHIGALSDRVGRKWVLVIASFGGLVTEIVTIIIGNHPSTVSVYWMLLGALADGLSGSFTSAMAISFAYASDCTDPKKRAVSFGYFQGSLFGGFALGPIIAGWLIKEAGTVMIVFYAALGCHLFYITFLSLLVPESLSKERQMIAREKYAKEWADDPYQGVFALLKKYNIFQPLWVLWPTGPGSSPRLRQNLVILATIDTMMFGVAMGTLRIILNYAAFRYGWNAITSSIYLSTASITRVSVLLVLLPLLNWLFRGSARATGHKGSDSLDIWIIRFATVFDLLGYLGFGLSPTGAFMFVSGIIAAFGGIGSPTLQSSITKHLPAIYTGQVLGAMGLLHALARVVSPTLFNLIYGFTVRYYSGIVFLCLASVFVVVFILSWFLKAGVYLDEAARDNETEADPTTAYNASTNESTI